MKQHIVLITGVTGSLGTALLKYFEWDGPIRGLSRDEQKQEKLRVAKIPQLRLILGDIRDPEKLRMAMVGVDTVIHCAALKIVPQGCFNADEIMNTNAVGTLNVCREAIHAGVKRTLVVSSDKAVEPTTLYGATKMCAEHIAIQANSWTPNPISVVRFGNLIGSRGAITEWMEERVRVGETLEITSEEMTRFWMPLRQAVTFIELCLADMTGGEIFSPKIRARPLMDMIPENARIRVIGPRQQERTYETLVSERELEHTDETDTHFIIRPWPYVGNTRRINAYRSDDPEPRWDDPARGGAGHGEGGLKETAEEVQGDHHAGG